MLGYLKKQRAIQEIDRRRSDPLTYTTPVEASDPNEWKDFLNEFYRSIIFGRREELKQEMSRYPIVNQYYQTLVVTNKQLAYEDFWQRYLFRCGDIDRVIRQLDERDAQFRKESIQKLKGSIVGSVEQYYQQVTTIASAASSSPSSTGATGQAEAAATTTTTATTTVSKSPPRAAFQAATTCTDPKENKSTDSQSDDHEKKEPGEMEILQPKDENQEDAKEKATSIDLDHHNTIGEEPLVTCDHKQRSSIFDKTVSSSATQKERIIPDEDTAQRLAPIPTSVTKEQNNKSGHDGSSSTALQLPPAQSPTKVGVSNFLSSLGFSKDASETALTKAVSSSVSTGTYGRQVSNPQEDDQQKQRLERDSSEENVGDDALKELQTQTNTEKELRQNASQTLICPLKYNTQQDATEARPTGSQVADSAKKSVEEISSFFRGKGLSAKVESPEYLPQSSISSSSRVTKDMTDSQSSKLVDNPSPDEFKTSSEPLIARYSESKKVSYFGRMIISTTTLIVLLAAALLGLWQSIVMDGLCGPVIPFRRFDQPVSGKAPWWSPDESKTMNFGKLCGNRLHTGLILDQKGKFEMWTTKSKKVVKRHVQSFYVTTNSIILEYQNDSKVKSRNIETDSHLKTELLKAPWSKNT
jgi:hypothetical protein